MLPPHGAIGKVKYNISLLVVVDLATAMVRLIPIDGSKMKDIVQSLDVLALRYRLPEVVISDVGLQLQHLKDDKKTEFMSAVSQRDIQLVSCYKDTSLEILARGRLLSVRRY